MGSYDEVRWRIFRDLASLSIFFDLREAAFSTFSSWGRARMHKPILAVPPYNVNVIKDIHTDLDASYPESLAQSKPFHTIGWLHSTAWVLLAKSGSQPLPP